MKRIYFLPLILSLFALSVFAQTPTPTATPTPVENDDDVVKISTTLIQVDVTVTDKKGKIVTDLKPEEVEIYENGKKQDITNFSFISNQGAKAAPKTEPTPKNTEKNNGVSIPIPPVNLRPEQVKRTIALVIDDLGIAFENMIRVRAALKRFVTEEMQPNDLVAIIRTGSGIGALQQFTSDKNQLYAAIDKIQWNPQGRAGISTFAPVDTATSEADDAASAAAADAGTTSEESLDTSDSDLATLRDDIFSVGTLGAVNFVVKGMKELPGRKAIVLFSDGFTICASDGSDNETDPNRCTKMYNAVKQLTDFANRSSVTIYSLDAKGLVYTGPTAGDSMGTSATALANTMTTRSMQNLDQQDGLSFLAKETGGQAYFNNNDMVGIINAALEDQNGYYLVAYQPDAEAFDPKTHQFNKLEVKLKRPGLNVRYRSGFFGIEQKDVVAAVQTPVQQMVSALSSPFASNGINLHLNTFFGADKQKSGFMQSFLHIDARGLKFTDEPDGSKKASIELIAMSFGDNGVPVDQIGKNYTLSVSRENYQKTLQEGFVYNFSFPVKTAGAYQMRVAVRDTATSKVGSANQFIEVPDLKKGKIALSGIVLQNLSLEEWKNSGSKFQKPTAEDEQKRNPMADTSYRRFNRGTILRYAVDIYNAKLDKTKTPQLQTQVRVFHDGKLALPGKLSPIKLGGQTDFQTIHFGGALALVTELPKGDYVLQIIVTDGLAKTKQKLATQWIQFEVQ